MTTEARQKAHRRGHAAEWRAVWFLRLIGYSILARRYKTRLGEIDIVARRGNVLAFVEVKARGDAEAAAFALGNRQFGRVSRAASLFIARHPRYAGHSLRFDAVLVSGLWPRHLPDVWQPPE
jgi:putative endonuclease